jgi:hypothetical protein
LDGHTGGVPNLKAQVAVDHTLAVSSYEIRGGNRVHYRGNLMALESYLAPLVIGQKYDEKMPNGDFICHLSDVRNAQFRPLRISPTQLHK